MACGWAPADSVCHLATLRRTKCTHRSGSQPTEVQHCRNINPSAHQVSSSGSHMIRIQERSLASPYAASLKPLSRASRRRSRDQTTSITFHRPSPPPVPLTVYIATTLQKVRMDSIVAQYSRPMYEDEGYDSEEQLEITRATPSISLKFSMPSVSQVRPISPLLARLRLR